MNLIFEVFDYEVTNTLLANKLGELAKIYTYNSIYAYIQDNFEYLNKTMLSKTFENEQHKIRYFLAIIKNNIVDYRDIKGYVDENNDYIKDNQYEIIEVRYKTNIHKRRPLYEIEMELIAEDE